MCATDSEYRNHIRMSRTTGRCDQKEQTPREGSGPEPEENVAFCTKVFVRRNVCQCIAHGSWLPGFYVEKLLGIHLIQLLGFSPFVDAVHLPPPVKVEGMATLSALFALVVASIFVLWILPQQHTTHYEVLGVQKNASMGEITEAYERKRESFQDAKLHEAEHAFYVLSNPLRRRDYDHFGLDSSKVEPDDNFQGTVRSRTADLNMTTFKSVLESGKPWLIQIYSLASHRSTQLSTVWERLADVLDGQVELGRVELGDVELVQLLAEKNLLGSSVFRQGLPELVAFPSECKRLDCLLRYSQILTYESILDWTATTLLELPRILYYSSQNLGPDFLRKSGLHKVKVLIFSETGERALPYMRAAAKLYSDYAAFACVLWRQNEAFLWQSKLGVESAPAVVILKDPGLKPVVVHGEMNRTFFMEILKEHKNQVLPQLRSRTIYQLGCDPAGHSMAGEDALTWYCVMAVGKPGYRLDQLRTTMRMVLRELQNDDVEEKYVAAANALTSKRLSLSWVDGTAQKKFCHYFLAPENVHETCGSRQYAEEEDTPKLVLVRFRKDGETASVKRSSNLWSTEEENLASILIARYNGTEEPPEILSWMSGTISDGDTQEIPFFRIQQAPVLTPEGATPTFRPSQSFMSRIQHHGRNLILDVSELLKDARLITILVTAASILLMHVWSSRPTSANK